MDTTSRAMDIYQAYHNDKFCLKCGKKEDTRLKFVDENSENYLLTNLEFLCEKHYYNNQPYNGFVTINREFTFDSSHNLLNYVGKCSRLHGHTYKLQICLRKRVDCDTGMVMDFGTLKEIVNEYVIEKIDHYYLNDIMPGINPTAENMLFWIWEILERDALLKGLFKIKLWETPNSYAEINVNDILNSGYIITY